MNKIEKEIYDLVQQKLKELKEHEDKEMGKFCQLILNGEVESSVSDELKARWEIIQSKERPIGTDPPDNSWWKTDRSKM